MAVASGPNVVEDGLVLSLDASSPKNYNVGVSTNWVDKVGGNNGTLYGGTHHTDGPFVGAGYVEFDGLDDYLSISSASSLGGFSGDFTIEFWFKGDNQAGYAVFLESWTSSTSSGQRWAIQAEGSGTTNMIWVRDGLIKFTTSGIDAFDNAWHHHAVVRNGSTINYYIDGVSRGSESHSASLSSGTDFIIGEYSSGDYEIEGHLSNVRIVDGTALYTSNFTPPTKSLTAVTNTKLLTCQGNTIADASSSGHTLTANGDAAANLGFPASAFEFDGTNDFISATSTSSVAFGTGDFAVETWVKVDDLTANHMIWETRSDVGSTQDGLVFFVYGGNNDEWQVWTAGGSKIAGANGSVAADTWYHTVVTRISGTTTLYVNNVSIGSFSDSYNYSNDDLYIGKNVSAADLLKGDIAAIRIYNGKGLTAAEVRQNFNATRGRYGVSFESGSGGELYSFTSAFFTVSRALTDNTTSDTHRFGPNQSQVRAWLSGTSNGGGGHSWANTYVDCPQNGYQRWTIPKTGKYRITAKGGGSGKSDTPDDYMRGVKVIADFNLTKDEKLILAAGQGVPDYPGDHCNGGGGASWVMSGSDYATAIPLIVANGAGGDTSDGPNKTQANVTLGNSITVTPTSGEGGGSAVTGKQTYATLPGSTAGRGSQNTSRPNSGGWLSDGNDAGENNVGGHGFRSDLKGGIRSNNTAGDGGFGGGSGGEDESGSAGGGFTGAYGEDGSGNTGHGSSFVNDDNQGNVSVALAQATTTFQNTDYTSEDQYQGWIKIEFIS